MADDLESKSLAERIPAMSDEELLSNYQQTNGEPGDPVADALCAEIERRGLDT